MIQCEGCLKKCLITENDNPDTIKVFENSEAQVRVLVLLTDGNDTGSKVPPKKAAEIAADHHITIHTVAIGDPQSTGEAAM